jgi:hypothetical protein
MLGTVLSTAFESVEDLQEVGITALHARALFKLIRVWNVVGVPPEDVLLKLSLLPPQATINSPVSVVPSSLLLFVCYCLQCRIAVI